MIPSTVTDNFSGSGLFTECTNLNQIAFPVNFYYDTTTSYQEWWTGAPIHFDKLIHSNGDIIGWYDVFEQTGGYFEISSSLTRELDANEIPKNATRIGVDSATVANQIYSGGFEWNISPENMNSANIDIKADIYDSTKEIFVINESSQNKITFRFNGIDDNYASYYIYAEPTSEPRH